MSVTLSANTLKYQQTPLIRILMNTIFQSGALMTTLLVNAVQVISIILIFTLNLVPFSTNT